MARVRRVDPGVAGWAALPRRTLGVGTRWMRGYGRWVREILVWTNAPFCSGMSCRWQMLSWALLAWPSQVRWGVLESMPRLWCRPSAARGS